MDCRVVRLGVLAVLVPAALGCAETGTKASDPLDSIGAIVFECASLNFAWGHTHNGYYVDRSGGVHRYDRSGDPWLPKSVRRGDSRVPESELLAKFQKSERYDTVPLEVLREKVRLLEGAARGKISKTHEMNDAGSHGCMGYHYDREQALYESINLGFVGDVRLTNSAREARDLSEWLRELRPPRAKPAS